MQHPTALQRSLILMLWLGLIMTACQKRLPDSLDATAQSSFATAPTSVEPLMPVTVSRIFERSCKSCHGPAGYGIAAIAPDIRRASARTTEQWTQYLTTGHPGATMDPPTWINVDEISLMANYLANLHATVSAVPLAAADDNQTTR